MPKEERLRSQVHDLAADINGEVDHGECFYEKDMLDGFIKKLDRMKQLAQAYYEENRREIEADGI